MTRIGTLEAKNRLSELLNRVAAGEEIEITRHGKPVARLVPAHDVAENVIVRHQAAMRELLELRRGITTDGAGWRELRDDGRRW